MANTDPILTSEGAVGRGFWNKGSQQIDGALVLPTVDTEFTNPDMRTSGKLRYNDETQSVEFFDGQEWISIASEVYVKNSKSFTYTHVEIPYNAEPAIAPSVSGFDEEIREIGNVIYDKDLELYITTYSGNALPYTSINVYIGLATSIDGKTWTKQGQIIFTSSEDPYLVKDEGTYYLLVERKGNSVPAFHEGIELFTTTDIFGTWTSQGIVIPNGTPGDWDGTDRSSPVALKYSGVWYVYFEGRAVSGSGYSVVNSGAIGVATGASLTSLTVNPDYIYAGHQIEAGKWFAYIVPDDIRIINNTFYLNAHAFNGTNFVNVVITTNDLDSNEWFDYYGTWLTLSNTNDDYAGAGIMAFETGGETLALCEIEGAIYLGKFTSRASDKNRYSSRASSSGSTRLTAALRNEIIDAEGLNQNRDFLLGNDLSSTAGCYKIIRNNSSFLVNIDPDTGVTLNGGTSNFQINIGEVVVLYTTDVNTWYCYKIVQNIDSTPTDGSNNAVSSNGVFDALALKFNIPAGTTAQYVNGAGGLTSFATSAQSSAIGSDTGSSLPVTSVYTIRSAIWALNNGKANLASPALTGTPTAPTATTGTNTTQVATTAFVQQELAANNRSVLNDSYTTVKTTAELEADYPSVPLPYYVIAKNTTGNPIIYIKHSVNVWMFQPLGFTS